MVKMKRLTVKIIVMATLIGFSACSGNNDPSSWDVKQINAWIDKGEWLNGWQARPDATLNGKAFLDSYFKNRERWDKAFSFMKENDLSALELRRYDIDGDNAYALVSEYYTKNEGDARYEAHRKYIDVQYVVSGKELIGITPLALKQEVLEPYDEARDIEFMTVSQGVNYPASPDRFFIFFPEDVHRPGLRSGDSTLVRKVVLKIKID